MIEKFVDFIGNVVLPGIVTLFVLCFPMVLFCSCAVSVTGPYTGTKYRLGVDAERGLFLEAKPLAFDAVYETISGKEDPKKEPPKEK